MTRTFLGDRVEYTSESIRLIGGGRFEQRAPAIFDHFAYGAGAMNSHVPQNWVTTETGVATPFAPGATGITVATGATGATTNNAEEIAGKLVGWNPSTMATKTQLVLEVRMKAVGTTTASDGDMTIGFADAVTYASGLAYVFSAASAFTTSAPTEFVGFHYSSIPTSGTLFNSAGNNFYGIVTTKLNVDSVAATTIAKDSNYHIFRVEMNSAADAAFYIDGTLRGTVNAAMTANTAMTPYVAVIAKNSRVNTGTIDYIFVGGDLV